jgi:hypothetical protein
VDEVNVQATVVIKVKEGGTRPDDLRHEMAIWGRTGVVNEVQADFTRDIGEPGRA